MNRMTARWFALIFPSFFAAVAWAQAPATRVEETAARTTTKAAVAPVPQQLFGSIQLSTRSAETRSLIELAWDKYENAIYYDAVEIAQRAAKKDPQSALAFAMTSFSARRTTPDLTALAKAKALLPQASPDEQLLVRWMTGIQDRDLLPAITSMNDLLKRFPNDKHILYVTAEWLMLQQDFDRAQSMMESALKLDPNFPAVLNRLGYLYVSNTHPDPDKALASLRHYAEVQPTSPNPQDSLGEISRIIGDDRASLQHYSAALQIDPTFFNSQENLGDTRTLMGDFAGARKEYDRDLLMTSAPVDLYWIRLQKAIVPFWEGHSEGGRKALAVLAEQADKDKEPNSQFQVRFARAMLAADAPSELQQLADLAAFLEHPLSGMSEADRGLNRAVVLRERVRVAAFSSQPEEAQKVISQLEELATSSRDLVVEDCYESARGYLLFSQGYFSDAADALAADPRSPLAVQLQAVAQEKLGNTGAAQETRARLKFLRADSVEWYLVTRSKAAGSN
jgi:tetratricopeptide (TPR) repeat protein